MAHVQAASGTLFIDQTGQSFVDTSSDIEADPNGGFSGTIGTAGGDRAFTQIQHIGLILSDDSNYVFADLAPVLAGATLNIDGGGGQDNYLQLNLTGLGDLDITQQGDRLVTNVAGVTFRHFQEYSLQLGDGTNHVTLQTGDGVTFGSEVRGGNGNDTILGSDRDDIISGGGGGTDILQGNGGDDTISSYDGAVDKVDGGSGIDTLRVLFTDAGDSFTFNGITGSGSTSGGSTFANIEKLVVDGAQGDDHVTLVDPIYDATLNGAYTTRGIGGGTNSLTIDESGTTSPTGVFAVGYSNTEYPYINGYVTAPQGTVRFINFQTLDVTLDDGDDNASAGNEIFDHGATLRLDGGKGNDTLSFYASKVLDFTVNADGSITSNVPATFLGFENYYINGGAGANHIVLGAGNDTIFSTLSSDDQVLIAGDGNNFVIGGSGDDFIQAGSGNDMLQGGGGGFDTLSYANAAAGVTVDLYYGTVKGGAGDDRVSGFSEVIGSNFNDTLIAYRGSTLHGGAGNDLLVGSADGDVLDGGAGIDTASYAAATAGVTVRLDTAAVQDTGGAGDDRIVGVEKLIGSAYADQLTGNAGDNRIDGGAGADRMAGGAGNDTYIVDDRGDKVIERADAGYDTVFSSVTYSLGANVERLVLTGDAAIGGTGNALGNAMTGNAANNSLNGGDGNDTIDGALRSDVLTGGAGGDRFVFSTGLGAGNVDRITDFGAGPDKIQLSDAIFVSLGTGTLSEAAFKDLGKGPEDADDHILYNPSTGALAYDRDGVGGAAAVQFATLDNHAPLHAADIVVI